MPPKITFDCLICESNTIFRCASRSPKQHPVGLGELIPERKFQLLKRGAINTAWKGNTAAMPAAARSLTQKPSLTRCEPHKARSI